MSELTQSPLEDDHKASQKLHEDFQSAQGRIWSELVTKLSYFHQLPWKLLHMSHHDAREQMIGAQECLKLWEEGNASGKWHTQSKRFLDPKFPGGFRHLVAKLASGHDLCDDSMQPLRSYLSRMSCIRLAERSVEGIHSVVTRVYKRAPHASIPYISVELRFRSFWESVSHNPAVTPAYVKQVVVAAVIHFLLVSVFAQTDFRTYLRVTYDHRFFESVC